MPQFMRQRESLSASTGGLVQNDSQSIVTIVRNISVDPSQRFFAYGDSEVVGNRPRIMRSCATTIFQQLSRGRSQELPLSCWRRPPTPGTLCHDMNVRIQSRTVRAFL